MWGEDLDSEITLATPEDKATIPEVKYEYLDHPADVQIHAWGSDLREAYEQAAMGMFGYMTDLATVDIEEVREVEAEAEDLEGLLFHFLDECLFVFSCDPFFVARKVEITEWLAGGEDVEEGEGGEKSKDSVGEEGKESKGKEGKEEKVDRSEEGEEKQEKLGEGGKGGEKSKVSKGEEGKEETVDKSEEEEEKQEEGEDKEPMKTEEKDNEEKGDIKRIKTRSGEGGGGGNEEEGGGGGGGGEEGPDSTDHGGTGGEGTSGVEGRRRGGGGGSDGGNGAYRIRAKLFGEEFQLGKHPQGTEVKAITYASMQVYNKPDQHEVFVIVDI